MQYRRVIIPGATYFFTLKLANRNSTLLLDHITELRWVFKKVRSIHMFTIDAIVIMPNHLHLLLTLPPDDINYALRLNLIKGNFSRLIPRSETISGSRKAKRERAIWQRRYWEHAIRDDRDYRQHIDYIHYNPVKHGYVKNPRDWLYSSIHRFLLQGLIPADWAMSDQPIYATNFGE